MFAALASGTLAGVKESSDRGNKVIEAVEDDSRLLDSEENKLSSYCSLENLEDEDEEEMTPGVGLVHQAVLDNNPEKLEKLIEVNRLDNLKRNKCKN